MKDRNLTVEQLAEDPSFIRWIEGEADRREAAGWSRWVQKNEQNRRLTIQAQQRITGFAFKEPKLPRIQDEWDSIRHKIEDEGRKKAETSYSDTPRRDVVSMVLKAAAVLAVGIFAGMAAYMYQGSVQVQEEVATHTVTTDYGQTKTIKLSDGSQVILAAHSRLTYKENWLEQPTKRLSLEGEAFFVVAPQKTRDHPKLVVKTEDGTASVWGTRFTVDTYGSGTRVVLEEGEVQVDTRRKDQKVTMKPGEMATFSSSSQQIQVEKVNPRVYTSWYTNELFFDNTPFSVLINRIERTYGIKVDVQDSTILQKNLSGSVDFQSLESLTDAVARLFNLEIQRSGETLIINQ